MRMRSCLVRSLKSQLYFGRISFSKYFMRILCKKCTNLLKNFVLFFNCEINICNRNIFSENYKLKLFIFAKLCFGREMGGTFANRPRCKMWMCFCVSVSYPVSVSLSLSFCVFGRKFAGLDARVFESKILSFTFTLFPLFVSEFLLFIQY